MNAIIALCHFCETHGPSSVFCTQTLREIRLDELDLKYDAIKNNCAACNSIGNAVGFLSKDSESNANFLSTQTPVIDETITMVKQGAVRSLSCEVSSNKEGGFVFFGDTTRGHILSHTFYVRDSEARGFNKLYSVIILMKDKLFLLNIKPFLSEQLLSISKEIQNYAETVYNMEQKNCSQRSQRLNSGQTLNTSPRSMSQLTGEKNIFGILHSHFACLLWTGARYLTETITLGSPQAPPWLGRETEEGFAMVQIDKEEFLLKRLGFESYMTNDEDENYLLQQYDADALTLRECRNSLGSDFISACYCIIVGLQLVLRGPPNITINYMRNFKKILPSSMHKLIRFDCDKYLQSTDCRIISLSPDKAVPQPSNNIFRIDFIGESVTNYSVTVKWLSELPNKWPNLLIKINKAVDEPLLSDTVLDKHLKVLIGEWKNKVQCIQKLNSNQDISKMKRILGIQPQDQQLINYWISHIS